MDIIIYNLKYFLYTATIEDKSKAIKDRCHSKSRTWEEILMPIIPKRLRQLREIVLGVADSLGVKLDEVSDIKDIAECYELTVSGSIEVKTAVILAQGVLTAWKDICDNTAIISITPRIWNIPPSIMDEVVNILEDYYAPQEIEKHGPHQSLWDVGSEGFIDCTEAVAILQKVAEGYDVDANLTFTLELG